MTFWEYVHLHPWIAVLALLILGDAAQALLKAMARSR